jgi:hypothetical protein
MTDSTGKFIARSVYGAQGIAFHGLSALADAVVLDLKLAGVEPANTQILAKAFNEMYQDNKRQMEEL